MRHDTKKRMNVKFRSVILLFLTILLLSGTVFGRQVDVKSPDGQLHAIISESKGQIQYRIAVKGDLLVQPSRLGLHIGEKSSTWQIMDQKTRSVDEHWNPVYGKRSRIHNQFNELVLSVATDAQERLAISIVFRAYNDGIAFRYRIASRDTQSHELKIKTEATEIKFSDDLEWWNYRRELVPEGPRLASTIKGSVNYPLYAQSSSGTIVALMEANLRNYPWAIFTSEDTETGFSISPKTSGTVALPFETAWRVIMIGESAGQLIDSDLIMNLNPRAKKETYTWLKPGISFWDWRAWGYKAEDGFRYDMDLVTWKRFIDFAAETGVPYLLLDANWYGDEFSADSDPFSGGKSKDVKEAIEYGKQKNVGLILYLNDVAAKKYGTDKILSAYAEWGAKGVKYGFMKGLSPMAKVKWTHRVAELCAQNQLLVNFHDGLIPPTGEETNLPNFVHREFCHAQSDAQRAFGPSDFIKTVHVNMLAGPLDMNNGLYDLDKSEQERPKIFQQVNSTILAETARTLITYGGGVTVIPDAADSYRQHPALFRFISEQKPPWTDSKTLTSKMGAYISMMRQTGNTYLVGTVSNESERDIELDLSFLPKNTMFTATIFSDTPESHYLKNRTAYTIAKRQVTSKDKINVHIAQGSGHCMIIEAESGNTFVLH